MGLAELIFWFFFLVIGYTYVGYPMVLFVWSRLYPKKVNKGYAFPEPLVSIIIAAYNEEENIGRRIENIFQQKYPTDKMEVIVVSDGSTDRTSEIIEDYKNVETVGLKTSAAAFAEIKHIKLKANQGKPTALNRGVSQAIGEFIIFTDARQAFEPDAVKELLANFNDPLVGCVSGQLIFRKKAIASVKEEMEIYWNFEKQIRKMESATNSVVGATGAIYAIRRSLYKPIPAKTLLDDVYVPMNAVLSGYRTVFDSSAIAYDVISKDIAQEKKRKIRTLFGNYQILSIMPQLLSPRKNPIFLEYVSHKILRLFIPFAFIIITALSIYCEGIFYKMTLSGITLILILALLNKPLANIPFFSFLSKISITFLMLNYFAVLAFLSMVIPNKEIRW